MSKKISVPLHRRRNCDYTVDKGTENENLLVDAVMVDAQIDETRCLSSEGKPDYGQINGMKSKDTNDDNAPLGFRFKDIEKRYWEAVKENKIGSVQRKHDNGHINRMKDEDTEEDSLSLGFRFRDITKSYWEAMKERKANSVQRKSNYGHINRKEDKDTDEDSMSLGFRFIDIKKSYWDAVKERKIENCHQKVYEVHNSSDNCFNHDNESLPNEKEQCIFLDRAGKEVEYTIKKDGKKFMKASTSNTERSGFLKSHTDQGPETPNVQRLRKQRQKTSQKQNFKSTKEQGSQTTEELKNRTTEEHKIQAMSSQEKDVDARNLKEETKLLQEMVSPLYIPRTKIDRIKEKHWKSHDGIDKSSIVVSQKLATLYVPRTKTDRDRIESCSF